MMIYTYPPPVLKDMDLNCQVSIVSDTRHKLDVSQTLVASVLRLSHLMHEQETLQGSSSRTRSITIATAFPQLCLALRLCLGTAGVLRPFTMNGRICETGGQSCRLVRFCYFFYQTERQWHRLPRLAALSRPGAISC